MAEEKKIDDKNIKYKWVSRNKPQLHTGNTYIRYWEDALFLTVFFGLIFFFFGALGSWAFNTSYFPRPPETDQVGTAFGEQLWYWCKYPFFMIAKDSFHTYNLYMMTLKHYGYLHLLLPRMMLAYVSGLLGAYIGFMMIYSKPIKAVFEEQVRGIRLLEGKEAEDELIEEFAEELKTSKKFSRLTENVYLSFQRLFTHSLLFGNSGSGKTQVLVPLITKAIQFQRTTALFFKLLVLDPKRELAPAFFVNDGSMAVINANHELSHVPDLCDMLRTEGLIDIFIKQIFPVRESEDFFDGSSKEILKGLIIYSLETIKDSDGKPNMNWSDLSDVCDLSIEQKYFALKKYYPTAANYLGVMDVNTGQLIPSETSANIIMSFDTATKDIKKIGRYWYNNPDKPQKTINLTEFILNPNYKIKTLFIQNDALDSIMSNTITKLVLVHCAKVIESSPNNEVPQGLWVCDEAHRPGALLDLDSSPIFKALFSIARAKLWGVVIAAQSILDFQSIYKDIDIKAMKEASSSYYLTGTPIGDTNKETCEYLAEAFMDKIHMNESGAGDNKNFSKDIQEHPRKVLLQNELTAKLKNKNGNITYLAIFAGCPNVYILSRKHKKLDKHRFNFIERTKRKGYFNPDSKVSEIIDSEMKAIADARKLEQKTEDIKKEAPKAESITLEKSKVEITEYDEEILGSYVDSGQHMDAMSEEEKKFYEDNEESLGTETIKDIALETITDSHAIGIASSLLDKINERANNPHDNKIYKQAIIKSKTITKD